MACAKQQIVDYIIPQKYIEIQKITMELFYFTLMIVNDTLYIFLRIKLM